MAILRITGGSAKGRELASVPDKRVRPTQSLVRQSIFNIIEIHEKSFLELFCGSAVVSLEALSRGATRAAAVDISFEAVRTARRNAQILGFALTVKRKDFRRFLFSCEEVFDMIFADPPYNRGFVQELVRVVAQRNVFKEFLIIQKDKREEYFLPKQLMFVDSKKYGDTEVLFIKRC